MKKQWKILFCDAEVKQCPVSDFMMSCKTEHQIKLLHFFELLEEMGPNLPRPYADTLRNGIHELRVRLSGEQYRLLYFFFFERYIIFFDAFPKYTYRVSDKYIRNTINYRNALLEKTDKDNFIKRNYDNSFHMVSGKLNEKAFKKEYDEKCNVCSTTVSLINKYYELGVTKEELAHQINVSEKDLTDLEDANNCKFDVVEKLCIAFNIPVPTSCIKETIRLAGNNQN
jgi:DNA-binding Xre family transcriptional regulator